MQALVQVGSREEDQSRQMEQAWSLLGLENMNLARTVWVRHCDGNVQAVAYVPVVRCVCSHTSLVKVKCPRKHKPNKDRLCQSRILRDQTFCKIVTTQAVEKSEWMLLCLC